MGGIGDEHARALVITTIFVILVDDHCANQLTLCTSSRLQSDRCKASDLFEHFLQGVHQIKVSLDSVNRLEGMCGSEARQATDSFVDLGVVFHRAGAKRVKTQIDGVILLRNAGEMTDNLHF